VHEVTELLMSWRQGEAAALDRLIPVVYDELRRVARRRLRGESPALALQSAALVCSDHAGNSRLNDVLFWTVRLTATLFSRLEHYQRRSEGQFRVALTTCFARSSAHLGQRIPTVVGFLG
jgi:hypothetical protein